MHAIRWCAAVAAVGFGSAAAGEGKDVLPGSGMTVLEKAPEVTVYSLAGQTVGEAPDGAWHGAKALGKTTLKKDEGRKAVVGAVAKAVAEGGKPAGCFIPRHGVEATHDGKSVALVICFECGHVHVYGGDKRTHALTISPSAQKTLNDVLTAAGVKLDKPEK